jgi:hypothetical protein
MSFDGDFQTERPDFDEVDKAWRWGSDIGSKWFFYPFYFVTSASTKTIVAAPHGMELLEGKRTATVVKLFEECNKLPEANGMSVDDYLVFVMNRLIPA